MELRAAKGHTEELARHGMIDARTLPLTVDCESRARPCSLGPERTVKLSPRLAPVWITAYLRRGALFFQLAR
jgi:hypothetical protein